MGVHARIQRHGRRLHGAPIILILYTGRTGMGHYPGLSFQQLSDFISGKGDFMLGKRDLMLGAAVRNMR